MTPRHLILPPLSGSLLDRGQGRKGPSQAIGCPRPPCSELGLGIAGSGGLQHLCEHHHPTGENGLCAQIWGELSFDCFELEDVSTPLRPQPGDLLLSLQGKLTPSSAAADDDEEEQFDEATHVLVKIIEASSDNTLCDGT